MLGVTKLLCEIDKIAEGVKSYGHGTSPRLLQFSNEKRPVVVWNVTRRCNLHCVHCYSDSFDHHYNDELSTEDGINLINDLADFKVPVLIFSGGDPILRQDLFHLAKYAMDKGIRTALSTNGILIDKDIAKKIKDAGFAYVGVSLDGTGAVNDSFRGAKGAFKNGLAGMRHCRDAGIRVGIRFTMSKRTINELPKIFELAEKENIPRIYISHLVYSGRGERIKKDDLSHDETRHAMDFIFDKTMDFYRRGLDKDVLTGNNDADGVYLYLKARSENTEKAEKIYAMLKKRGGNSSGVSIGCIDSQGYVHPDQFWFHYSFGNVKERRFSEIWNDTSDALMKGLKNKTKMVKGRCKACHYLDICGGNYRVRAEVIHSDVWAEDPGCYLTDEEIGIARGIKASARGGY
ncbi:MAG: radical SAM protein [Deltaproteobacteria bacterium]|nr:radical SAM protein [Deltaproteobacteria bacterium]